MDFQLRANFVCFMSVMCVFMMSWVVLNNIHEAKIPEKTCECVCIDPSQVNGQFQYRSVYTGYRTGKTCECEDFILPVLKEQLMPFREANSTCQYCDCGDYRGSDCDPKGKLNLTATLQTMTATMMVVTCFMWMHVATQAVYRGELNFPSPRINISILPSGLVDRINLILQRRRNRGGYEQVPSNTDDIYEL